MNQFKRSAERGFTLIELLVVIAIIGVLSSVVLSSLNSARGKGNDAKVKAQLSSARGSAEIYYSNQTPPGYGTSQNPGGLSSVGTGTGVCNPGSSDPSGMQQYLLGSNYPDSVSPACYSTPTAYKVFRTLPFVNKYWCVDSAGASKEEEAAPAADSTPCL